MMSEQEAWNRLYMLFCRSLTFREALYRYNPELFRRFSQETRHDQT